MSIGRSRPLKIGIIGAGFAGTAMAALLLRQSHFPVELILCDKTGSFGTGDAYSTPFPFHLLNARARDMSAFEDQPAHFVAWLTKTQDRHLDKDTPVGDQFVPRFLYGDYLHALLRTMQASASVKTTLQLEPTEVIDLIPADKQITLVFKDQRQIKVDKIILALGNGPPSSLLFPVAADIRCIQNPWDYAAPKQIPAHDPVLMVGTGLSMIDAVLTLYHQQHRGQIYAVSRRGLLPLPHADIKVPFFSVREHMPGHLRALTKYLRVKSKSHAEDGGDWRSVINAVRTYIPALWAEASLADKQRFLRHLLPYWNIHRHRVHPKVAALLTDLSTAQQLNILSGRIIAVEPGMAKIKLRHTNEITQIKIKWLINCMGPALYVDAVKQPLIQALLQRGMAVLDALNLGFDSAHFGELKEKSGAFSTQCYALGSLRKGMSWESVAVPEIRKQCFDLVNHLIAEMRE